MARALPSVLTVSLHLRHEIHACVCTCTWLLHSLMSHSAGGVVDCLSLARSACTTLFLACAFTAFGWGCPGGLAEVTGEKQERPWAQRWAARRDPRSDRAVGVEQGGRCVEERLPEALLRLQERSSHLRQGVSSPTFGTSPRACYSAPQEHLGWLSFPKMGRHQEVCVLEVPGSPPPRMEVRAPALRPVAQPSPALETSHPAREAVPGNTPHTLPGSSLVHGRDHPG